MQLKVCPGNQGKINIEFGHESRLSGNHDLRVVTDYINANLSAKDREIMSLYLMQESQAAIAEIIGLEVATIINRISILKNREARAVYITDEILEILTKREVFRISGNNFVFHVEGAPLNYCTIQINYRAAQRKSGIPYTGTHILRHGMAKLARKVGGGLDAVLAMTGHKDLKLADHYSKSNEDDQKDFSQMIMKHIREELGPKSEAESVDNVFRLKLIKSS